MAAEVAAAVSYTPAWIGLAGVFLGGLITAGANYLLAIKRERSEAAKDRRIKIVEISTAARMVRSELATFECYVHIAMQSENPLQAHENLQTSSWEKYGSTLAAHMTYERWYIVEGAYFSFLLSKSPEKYVRLSLNVLDDALRNGMVALERYVDPDSPNFPTLPE